MFFSSIWRKKYPLQQWVRSLSHESNTQNSIKVALLGRTNVGKSTLFNRLTKSRAAIVHNVPGTTRDRRMAKGQLAGINFDVIDTGGLEDAPKGSLEEGMLEQTQKAVHESDLILFLVDGRNGITDIDEYFAKWLRKENPSSTVRVVVNKVEGYPGSFENSVWDAYKFGFGDPIPISAEHGEGMGEIVDTLIPIEDRIQQENNELIQQEDIVMENTEDEESPNAPIKLAIVGRPNVGKSTLLNRIVKQERVLTGPNPGVTRDSIEVEWSFGDKNIKLVDTAGIRRASKRDHDNQIENLSVRDSYRAISTAQVVVLVVDLSEKELIQMDLSIAEKAIEEGRGLIIAANKSDVISNTDLRLSDMREELDTSLAQVRGVPVVPISALEGKGIRKLMPSILTAYDRWNLRVSTGVLNRWLKAISRYHPPPTVKGKPLKLKYMTQIKSRPPTFTAFVNKPNDFPEKYKRFLVAQLREEFDMVGVPIRLLLRGTENPYYCKSKKKNKGFDKKKKTLNQK